MIYDVIVVAILLVSLVVGYNRGAAKTVVSLFGFALSFVLSAVVGDYLAELIYNGYLSDAILNCVSTSITDSGVTTLTTASLPQFVSFAVMLTGFDYQGTLQYCVDNVPNAIAASSETAVKPVVMSVLSFVITAVAFAVLYFVLRFVFSKLLKFVFSLPVLKGFNKVLGALISLCSGLLTVSFIAFLLNLVMPYISDMPYYLSESTIYNSYIFYHFYSGNIFNTLISIF